jgi:hypothetical protein
MLGVGDELMRTVEGCCGVMLAGFALGQYDKDRHQIAVDDQSFAMPTGGGAAMMPQVGAEITLFYRDEGDKKLITRIGQAQQ